MVVPDSCAALPMYMKSPFPKECAGLFQPLFPLRWRGTHHRPEQQSFDRLDATERQRRLAHLMQRGHAVEPSVIPRRRVQGHQQMRGSALQEFVGESLAFTVFEGETRQENSVDKT